MIARAREQAGLTAAELAEIVGIGTRSCGSTWAAGRGTPATSARLRQLLDLQYVLDLVGEVFDDEGGVMWLHARNRTLGGERPLNLLAQGRTDEVIDLLDRIADWKRLMSADRQLGRILASLKTISIDGRIFTGSSAAAEQAPPLMAATGADAGDRQGLSVCCTSTTPTTAVSLRPTVIPPTHRWTACVHRRST